MPNGSGSIVDFAVLNHIVTAIPASVLLVSKNGLIQQVNRELEITLQYSQAELFQQPLDMLLPERFRQNHAGMMATYIQHPVKRSMGQGQALFARKKNGDEIQIEIGLNPIFTNQGVYVLATMANVTARKKADLLFRHVVESAPYGVLVMDSTGNISLANRMLCNIFGYQAPELLGKRIEVLLPERHRVHHVQLRSDYAENPVMRSMGPGRDLTGLHRDGSEFPVEIGLNPVEIDGEQCMLAAVIDITERKKMELDLRRANTNLEEFTYVASHDLRSPLRGIADLLSWIQEDIGENPAPTLTKNIERITVRITRMERLIDNLLSYARAGQAATEFQEIDLGELMNHVCDLIQIPPGFQLIRELEARRLISAVTPLETVMRNLISNAIKHHDREQGTILVRSTAENSFCHISVTDDGPGIPEQAHDRVFKLFQTLNSSERGGTGIGLAVSKRLVESHGGKISVTSDPIQRVTTFNVWWPRFARRDINDGSTN